MNLGHDFNDSDESQIGTQDSIVKNMSNSFLRPLFKLYTTSFILIGRPSINYQAMKKINSPIKAKLHFNNLDSLQSNLDKESSPYSSNKSK